jgi:hypothetical protein
LFITSKNRQTQRLEYLQKKLGSCITKAKSYYEALENAEKLQYETQKAVIDFQKANSLYKLAKEQLTVAEQSLENHEIPDVWQDHLSSAVTKINYCKKTADQAGELHRLKAIEYQMAEKKSQYLEKELKRPIAKSKLYYDEKSRWNTQMEAQKMRINELEQALIQTKVTYKEAMINLSKISEEIHNKRKMEKLTNADDQQNESHKQEQHQNYENDTQIKKYLDLYKISLPNEQEQSNNEKISNYLNNNDLKAETIDSLEYVSLGLNSTASNSRCSSPSNNSIEADEWKQNNRANADLTIHQANNRLELLSDKSELSSKTNSFSSSSMSHGSSSNEFHVIQSYKNNQPKRSMTIDTGFRSLSSEFDLKNYESFNEPHKLNSVKSNASMNSNEEVHFSDKESTSNITKTEILNKITTNNNNNNNNNNKNKTNYETPLLNNLMLHNSKRY